MCLKYNFLYVFSVNTNIIHIKLKKKSIFIWYIANKSGIFKALLALYFQIQVTILSTLISYHMLILNK